tara:strand:+ start:215 stop:919 length:705 start_codon:yes stop_codon:yes gene_type:complete
VKAKIEKKLAVITGASRGIGAALAKGLADNGIHVVLVARTVGALEELDDYINRSGGSATLVPMDLLDFPAIERLGASIYERWGKLDILIANAAILGQLSPIHHYDPNIWDDVLATNLTANQRLLRSLDPLLRRSEAGRIVFVSSNISSLAYPYWGAYAASKSGLETMAKTYAKEIQKTNIKVNIVDPGITRTKLRSTAFPGEDIHDLKSPDTLIPIFLKLCSTECDHQGELITF